MDDRALDARTFLAFVERIWPGDYAEEGTRAALSRTLNITAYDGDRLVGCLRVLTDGYFFGTITELLVLPEYQRRGIGSALLQLARANSPTRLYFGAQPQAEAFYERNGCKRSLQSYELPGRGLARPARGHIKSRRPNRPAATRAPGGIRTHGLPLRRRPLYPAELRAHRRCTRVHSVLSHTARRLSIVFLRRPGAVFIELP